MESARRARETEENTGVATPVSPGDSVLLLSSPMELTDADYCLAAENAVPPTESNVLAVTLNEAAEAVAERWIRCEGRLPDQLAVITVGDVNRSAAATDGGPGASGPSGYDMSTAVVSSPGDLTGLGIKLSQCLSAWEGHDNDTVVRFNSLTTLLQFADLKRSFRFIHVLTGRISSAGAVGYFHLDPEAHDEQTLATLRGLFDIVLERQDDGTWKEP